MLHPAVSSTMRSNQAYCGQLAQKQVLDWGVAYCSPTWAGLAEANQFREVVVADADSAEQACAAVEAYYRGQGARCRRWAPAAGQDAEPLAGVLAGHGFRRRETSILALERWPEPCQGPGPRILPARAMRQAYRATFGPSTDPGGAEVYADAAVERLDDASLDAFVALQGDRPLGRAALLQVGDIGRVVGIAVLPHARRRGVGTALLHHVLKLARRLAVRTVCAQVDAEPAGPLGFLERLGFAVVGRATEFDAE